MNASRRSLAKRVAYAVLGNPLLFQTRVKRIAESGAVTILNLHRVAPFDDSGYPPLDPKLFRALIMLCKKHFDIITFDQLGRREYTRAPLILSFDDGYRDFYEYACPIMDEADVQCNQNLIPASVASGRPPINVVIGDYIGRAPQEHLEKLAIEGLPAFKAGMDRAQYASRASAYLKNRPMAEQSAFAREIEPQLERTQEFSPAPMMNLDQVRAVAAVHEMGMHSFEHASMAYESDAYLADDLAACGAWMKAELGQAMRIYALPNGSYREEQIDIVRRADVDHILLVGEDFARGGDMHHRFTFDATGMSEVRFRAAGLRVSP